MSDRVFENIGTKLQKARKEKGWTLEKLSKQCGIASSNLSNYEGGSKMTLSTLISIVTALGVSYDSILSDADTLAFDLSDKGKNIQNIANAIEYLAKEEIITRKILGGFTINTGDKYVTNLMARRTAGAINPDPYNLVVVDFPYCIPVMRYVTSIVDNVKFISSENELDSFLQISKNILKTELVDIQNYLKR